MLVLVQVPVLISCHHASLGNIPKPTFLQYAITGFYAGFPGLTLARIRKYLTKAEAETLESTTYGHQKLVRQNVKSSRRLRSKIHNVTIAIIRDDDLGEDRTNMIAMDLPGRFPITSADGHKYIFIMYDCDSDYIKGIAMKNRETSEMVRCYSEWYDFFKTAGFTARLLRLDNEVSRTLINVLKKTNWIIS